MKTEAEIDALMAQIPERVRRHWCESKACACRGCVQASNRVMLVRLAVASDMRDRMTITREEWENWKGRHP